MLNSLKKVSVMNRVILNTRSRVFDHATYVNNK